MEIGGNTGTNPRIGPFEVFFPVEGSSPRLRHKWLESKGYGVVFSQWNSSELVKDTTKLGKKKKMLTPATFSLIHATDFADRIERNILPLLKAGAVVLCDRYIYTAFARDVARGMDRSWVRELYRFAATP